MGDNLRKAADSLLPAEVAESFQIPGKLVKLSPLGEGHINRTYKATFETDGGTLKKYVFQRVNTRIFTQPLALMANVVRVTDHIRKKAAAAGEDTERATLEFVPVKPEAAGEGGGYILCTSDNYFDAEPELLKAYADAAKACTY